MARLHPFNEILLINYDYLKVQPTAHHISAPNYVSNILYLRNKSYHNVYIGSKKNGKGYKFRQSCNEINSQHNHAM